LNSDKPPDPASITESGISTVYPNPSEGELTVCYSIFSEEQKTVKVSVKVYDLTGRVVGDRVDENLVAGSYLVKWNAGSGERNQIPYGIYFLKMTAGNKHEIKRIMLVK
jgi:hypothetical protein